MTPVSHVLFLAGGNGRNAIGGAEHHVITLVQQLASRGVDTELIVLLWQTDPHVAATLARLRESGVRVSLIERRAGSSRLLSRLFRALDCWRRLSLALRSRRTRVVHMHMELVAQVIAAHAAGCRRLVMTIHNDEPHYQRWLVRRWFRLLAAGNVQFVAITDHVRHYLIRSVRVPASSVRTIRYGVTPPGNRTRTRADLGLTGRDFVVGFVGRLTDQKNLPLLVRAMAVRPDITCLIVGDGERRSELEHLARTLGCSNVRFLGAHPDAASFMPLFDVLCLPSFWEGLGVVLLEAMLQDVPVVASRAGAIPEVLAEGACGVLIDPHSTDGLVRAFDELRGDADRRNALVKVARQHASTAYAVGRMCDEVCALYREICGRVPYAEDAAA